MVEDRAARALNLTMAVLLGALFLGFTAWMAVSEFSRVHAIYLSLSATEQGHVNRFLGSVFILMSGLVWAGRSVRRLLVGSRRLATNAERR